MSLEGLQLGRYLLVRPIGSGGMGEVYLATDTGLNRQVAIKVIRSEPSPYPGSSTAQDATRLFKREAKAIAMLDHSHILPLFDYGEQQVNGSQLTYLVMPFRAEGTLRDWLRRRGAASPLSADDIARLLQQAASALQYAHNHGIVHQDVKPSNFLIRSNAEGAGQLPDIMLADFGIASFAATTTNSMQGPRGTPVYMAPEQWQHHPVPATDQYALAVMAYELLTGGLPFEGNLGQLLYAHLHTVPAPPSSRNPRLSPVIDAVVLRALAKQPGQRYPSISEFAQAFQQAVLTGGQATLSASTLTQSGSPYGAPQAEPPSVPTYEFTRPAPPYWPTVPHSGLSGGSFPEGMGVPAVPEREKIILPTEVKRNSRVAARRVVLLAGLAVLVVLAGALVYFSAIRPSTDPRAQGTAAAQATVNAANAQASATGQAVSNAVNATSNPYPPNTGKLVLDDALHDNAQGSWRNEVDDFGSCQFAGQAYHVKMTLQGLEYCFNRTASVTDFAYQVQVTLVQGFYGGALIRGNPDNRHFYFCFLGQDGSYGIYVYSDQDAAPIATLTGGTSPAIRKGLGQPNLLGVVARGDTIELYANLQLLATVHDKTYSGGYVGAGVYTKGIEASEAAFTNAKLWQL